MIVTASQLKESSCFKRWYYRYELGIDPFAPPLGAGKPAPLEMGEDLHAAILQGVEPKFDETRLLRAGMAFFAEFKSRLELEAVERVVYREIGGGIWLAGRIDGLGTIDGEPCIYELKSGRSSPSDVYWNQKEMDAQILAYLAITGRRVAVVDHCRWPGVSKAKWGDKWADRVLELIRKDPSRFYARYVIRHSDAEVAAFVEDVKLWAELILFQRVRGRFLPVRSNCDEYNRTCPYWLLCKGRVRVEDCSRSSPFEELQPEIGELLQAIEEELPF